MPYSVAKTFGDRALSGPAIGRLTALPQSPWLDFRRALCCRRERGAEGRGGERKGPHHSGGVWTLGDLADICVSSATI